MAKNESLEAKILQTAEVLFMERGYDATSTTDIAKKAGCNQALVHYYYRTKENLFLQVFLTKFNFLMSYIQLDAQHADSLDQVISRLIDFYFHLLTDNRKLPFFMINEFVMNTERRKLLYDFLHANANQNSYFEMLDTLVKTEVRKGKIRPIDTVMLITDVISLIVFTFISLPLYSDFFHQDEDGIHLYLQQRKEEIKTLIMRGIFVKTENCRDGARPVSTTNN